MKKKLCEIGEIIAGGTPSTKIKEYWNGDVSWITPKDLSNYEKRFIAKGERSITQEGLKNSSAMMLPKNAILFTSRAPIGYVAIAEEELCTNQGFKSFVCDEQKCYYKYMYYWFLKNVENIKAKANGSTFQEISGTVMKNIEIELPDMKTQINIGNVLDRIDQKIELNHQINDHLLEIINCLYKDTFENMGDFEKAENIADITIGKTPPRREKECFTHNENDMKWISISDLGKSGTYILNTAERLTMDSVNKYHVKIIPENTILLSFKLTVGRIAITTEKMATNEAIAHFNLKNKDMKYYLYSYLKNFDYAKLGSTSSIATALNSKMIKAISIGIPSKEMLKEYNAKVNSMFEKILENEKENQNLEQLRDILLLKLIKEEINLDKMKRRE